MPVQFAEVMGDAAGANQQHTLAAQHTQTATDAVLQGGSESARQRQLHHWYIGLRVQQRQWHPGAVIQRTGWINLCHQTGLGQQFDNLVGEGGRAGGRVLNLIEWRRETAKVVQSGRLAGAADAQF